jgi:hypothetical protein
VALDRLSLDILLHGPTSISQIEAQVLDEGWSVRLVYTPPLVFLNAKQTTVRTHTSFLLHRIMYHEAELTTMIKANNNEEIKLRQTVRLKTPCD